MNFEQIVAKAQLECGCVNDGDLTRITVAAQFDKPVRGAVFGLFKDWAGRNGDRVKVVAAGSFGLYDLEPIVVIERPGRPQVFYSCGSDDTAKRLLKETVDGDGFAPDLAICRMGEGKAEGIPSAADLPLFKLQARIALRNCGLIDPDDISQYIAHCEGYRGLSRALGMGRESVIGELRTSGLRGRGGAGYPTAEKWKAIEQAEEGDKFVICNAVDGDARAKTAKLLLESDPHAIFEGLLIAAYATGASRAVVCMTEGNGRAMGILQKALQQMDAYDLVGARILGTDFACTIEVREVASSLVAGEETAILRALAGKQAMPYLRGNEPLLKGLEEKPTLVNNIETLANVSAILTKGAVWFAATGTQASTGSKVVSLSGMVLHSYTVEVPFGTMLNSVVSDVGGIPEGKAIKAVQFGGPTGCYLGTGNLETPIDFETMRASGCIMGFGTVEVIGDDVCAVEMTEQLISFIHSQSCGKCVFCREGTFQISDILKDIALGEGKQQDLQLITELAEKMRIGTICGLGRGAANPVLSSLRLFGSEYEVHIREKKCPGESKA
jgi:NADH-quinone oxidoreductase subunit F